MPGVKNHPLDPRSRIVAQRRWFLRLLAASAAVCLGLEGWLFATDPPGEQRLLAFGVLADVQYRDTDPRGTRYYRESAEKLRECVQRFNALRPDFVLQLGDLIDSNFAGYDGVLSVFEKLTMPKYHVLGNHDLAVKPALKDQVLVKLGLDQLGDGKGYYDFTRAGWHFVVLNGNDISAAKGLPTTERPEPPANLLEALRKGWTKKADAWNGVVGPEQREWLKRTLSQASAAGQQTIVFCHFPLCGLGGLSLRLGRRGHRTRNGKNRMCQSTAGRILCMLGMVWAAAFANAVAVWGASPADQLAAEINDRVERSVQAWVAPPAESCSVVDFESSAVTASWTEVWPDANGSEVARVVLAKIWNAPIQAALAKHGAAFLPKRVIGNLIPDHQPDFLAQK